MSFVLLVVLALGVERFQVASDGDFFEDSGKKTKKVGGGSSGGRRSTGGEAEAERGGGSQEEGTSDQRAFDGHWA